MEGAGDSPLHSLRCEPSRTVFSYLQFSIAVDLGEPHPHQQLSVLLRNDLRHPFAQRAKGAEFVSAHCGVWAATARHLSRLPSTRIVPHRALQRRPSIEFGATHSQLASVSNSADELAF